MKTVAERFGRAAGGYEQHAALQREVCERLLSFIAAQYPAPPRRVLEIGCGTGLLSRPLRRLWPEATLMCSDLAAAMVAECRRTLPVDLPGPNGFVVCRGEALPFTGPFDLIISSMTAQWFQDPATVLARWRELLAPGGVLAVALPVRGSLSEWEAALAAIGLPSGVQHFPLFTELETAFSSLESSVHSFSVSYPRGVDFLRELKGIGGDAPRDGYQPLGPLGMRRALAAFEAQGAKVIWQIGIFLIVQPEDPFAAP